MKEKHDTPAEAREALIEKLRTAYEALDRKGETGRRLAKSLIGQLLADHDQAAVPGEKKNHAK